MFSESPRGEGEGGSIKYYWIKINMNVSIRQSTGSTSIRYTMKDSKSNVIITINKRLRECHNSLVAEHETVFKVHLKGFSRIIIHNDSKMVVNTINRKIRISKDITYLKRHPVFVNTH